MKLTHFALAAVVVLLMVAGYLTIKSDFEAQLASQRDEAQLMNEKLMAKIDGLGSAGPAAAVPVTPPEVEADPSSVAGDPEPPPLAGEAASLQRREGDLLREISGRDPRAADGAGGIGEEAPGRGLSAIQRDIANRPAIARVKGYSRELEAVVLDRGERVNLRKGDEFALRRQTFVICRVRVGDTIDADECVADIVPGSLQPGMEPQTGDEAIQFDR